jgi:xylan 1,4-beta-xylosidase
VTRMLDPDRRNVLRLLVAGAAAAASEIVDAKPATSHSEKAPARWARGIEGQRKADLGDGRFLNPVLAGDHPDPSVLKDGRDYYLTCSSFDAYPGLLIWHSQDLVNWTPLLAALSEYVGSVWAPDLVKYNNKYFIYFPARSAQRRSTYVVHADDMRGPWSAPIDLGVERIDPGHAVGEDGKRYLFLSGGDRVPLADDGLRVNGAIEHVYDGWQYPPDWDVESFSQEGPKITRHGEYFYMTLAEGGTAGPPTGHMVVSARSRSIHGPWENAPHNPVVRTRSSAETWWSRGHATLVEGPDAQWWIMHHAYEKNYYTLGRQTLLVPIRWNDKGWFSATVDPSQPIAKPIGGHAVTHGLALSDDFRSGALGLHWGFYNPGHRENERASIVDGTLILAGKGQSPADSSPLTFVAGDRAYAFEVDIQIEDSTCAGLLLFYNQHLYVGLGFDAKNLILHRYGRERLLPKPPTIDRHLRLRISNDQQIVTIHYSVDAGVWIKFDIQMEVSGYHHNVGGDFLSLRPGLYAAGAGQARFRDVKYRALERRD